MQLFSPFGPGFGGADSGTNPDMTLVVRPCHWWWGCCWCFTACCGGKAGTNRDTLQPHAGSIWLCGAGNGTVHNIVFPWDSFHNWLGRNGGKLIGLFQYPWRFPLAGNSTALPGCCCSRFQLLKGKNVRLAKCVALSLVACTMLMTGVMQTQMLTGQQEATYNNLPQDDPDG